MADIGVPELLIILVIIIMLFGPSRIQGLGRSLGESIRDFRRGVRDEQASVAAEPPPAALPATPAAHGATDADTTA
jgi:sec-independent protein translocase protein TatA